MASLNNKNQNHWEKWFIVSTILFLSILFIGTLEPNLTWFPYYVTLTSINLIICIIVGSKN